MERNREARRGTTATNGLSRRRHRSSSSLRDSPEEDGAVEVQETGRLRDRGSKKDRDRDRDRERDRDRDRSSRSKRRRGNREEGGEESTEDSIDDEEEEEDEDPSVMPLRLPSMNPTPSAAVSMSSSTASHHQRKSFPTKVLRPVAPWKASEEMIGMSVPRKARSASVKRSHECWIPGVGGGSNSGEPIPLQASTSPARPSTVAAVPAAPISPTSSNASVRKKMKSIGTKHRPPKISKTSSIQESEIEIEIAEVLYGMTRLSSRDGNGSGNDAKSRGSSPSPISISPSTAVLQSPVLLQNSNNSTIVAPKRKRPRPLKLEEESPANFAIPDKSVSSPVKIEVEQRAKIEISLPKSEKNIDSAAENGWGSVELAISQIAIHPLLPQDSVNTESSPVPNPEPPKAESGCQDEIETKEIASPVIEPFCAKIDADLEDATMTKPESAASIVDCLSEKKRFKIDLMASPSGKSSPEIDDAVADLVTVQKPLALETETTVVPNKETMKVAAGEKAEVIVEEAGEVGMIVKKETIKEELDIQKKMVKESILNLQVDAEKVDKDGDKLQVQKQPTKSARNESKAEKAVQSASLPLPMTIAGWPGGLPPIGYIGQIPPSLSAVSMDGGTGSAMALQPPNFPLPQPRPKRCATHFYIAQNINYHRRLAQMNPFWPGAADSAALYGTKPCNVNVAPPSDSANLGHPLHGSFVGRNLSSLQDKDSSASLVDRALQDKNSPAMFTDNSQRKQLMLQQAPQPASANNILAPAFIFPLNQQQPVAVTRSGAVKPVTTSGSSSSSAPNSVVGSMASSEMVTTTNVSFNYANLPPNEAQYLAMLQSNGYPFPIPAHVGAPPQYRGSHHPAVPMPFFNGSFYSPQMLHPSQLQQQQHHPLSQPSSVQRGNQNTSSASGSQKHQQQQRMQGCIVNGGGGISNAYPTLKQPQQHSLRHHNSRQLENEMGTDDNPCPADSRVSHGQKSVYNHNFTMPIHPQNFIMSPAALSGGNQGERQQQQSLKGGIELNQAQAFAMSFAAFNGAAASQGLDFSSMAQSHAIFQGLPEAARHGYQMAASAAFSRTAQPKNHQTIEGKPVNNLINSNASGEEERKKAEKAPTTISHSTFSRPDNNPSMSTILGNGVVDSSSQTLNAISASGNGSRASSHSGAVPPATTGTTAVTNTTPSSQYHQQQMIQLHKQQQQYATRMTSASSNANVYSDRLPSVMGKFPNAVSVFPQALTQGSSPTRSPQWKIPAKAGTTPSSSLSDVSTPSAKNLPQQQGRTQLGVPSSGHTQISFGMNTKSSSGGQQFPSNNPPPSSAVGRAGSPTTSVSKSAGSSPGTAAGSKSGPVTMPLSSQPPKNTPSSSSRKSSPVSSQHVPASLGNSNLVSAQSSFVKSQQQQQQQQLQKQSSQQAQSFFNIHMQTQSPSSTMNSTTSGGYQKRQSEQQQQQQQQQYRQQQQPQNSLAVSSTGMLSLCSQPVPFSGGATSDPAKAVAAAAAAAAVNNLKGLQPQGFLHAAQFAAQSAGNPHLLMSAAIPYVHSMPAVPVKSAEQKPAAGT